MASQFGSSDWQFPFLLLRKLSHASLDVGKMSRLMIWATLIFQLNWLVGQATLLLWDERDSRTIYLTLLFCLRHTLDYFARCFDLFEGLSQGVPKAPQEALQAGAFSAKTRKKSSTSLMTKVGTGQVALLSRANKRFDNPPGLCAGERLHSLCASLEPAPGAGGGQAAAEALDFLLVKLNTAIIYTTNSVDSRSNICILLNSYIQGGAM